MATNYQTYRSVFTGKEIDQAIAAMKGSLSADLIVNDFSGGTTKIASAELAKILNNKIDVVNTPANIKDKLTSLTDIHLLNDSEYSTVIRALPTVSFRGTYSNSVARANALSSEYTSYKGNEISIIVDDGTIEKVAEISRWDTTINNWSKILFNKPEIGTTPIFVAASGTATNLFAYKTNRYSAIKILVNVSTVDGMTRQVQEVLVSHIGTDSYVSIYNEIGNSNSLFTVNTVFAAAAFNLIKDAMFNSSAWTKSGLSVSSTTVSAPDNTYSTQKLTENTSTNNHYVALAIDSLGETNTIRRFSIFAKAFGTRNTVRGWADTGNTEKQQFVLAEQGTATGGLSPQIQYIGDGWYRCSFSVPATNNSRVYFGTSDGTSATFAGDASTGVYLWGPQLQKGDLTDYVSPSLNVQVITSQENLIVTSKVIAVL